MPSSRATWGAFSASFEQLHDAVEIVVVERPPVTAPDARRVDLQAGRDRLGRLAEKVARLLEMDLEARALGRLVVGRAADRHHEVEHVLALIGTALLALLVGVVPRSMVRLPWRCISRKRCGSFSVIDPFAGSCNTLYWILRHVARSTGIAFEFDPQVYGLSRRNIAGLDRTIELTQGDYHSLLPARALPPDHAIEQVSSVFPVREL
jgi:hypothetical protein